jgi:hypothetical protein
MIFPLLVEFSRFGARALRCQGPGRGLINTVF